MCGRFTLRTPPAVLLEHFRLTSSPAPSPRYNIAPTQEIGVVRPTGEQQREFVGMRWGLVPHWAKDPSIGSRMINARSETAATTPAFRDSYRRRRCLIPADGFYEWKKVGRQKQPYLIHLKSGDLFAFAGLWDRWGNESQRLETCTILTMAASDALRDLHDRMPVILRTTDYDRWLDPNADVESLEQLFDGCPPDDLCIEPVSPRVNNVANDDASVLQPPPPMLFE